MISYGDNKCKIVSVAAADCVGVYAGNEKVFPSEIVYDESRIAVIELDASGNPTGNVEYFEASSTHGEPASSEYIKANTDKNFFLRFGNDSMNGMIDRGFYDGCANIKKLTLGCVTALASGCFSGCTGLENLYIPDNVNYIYDNAFSGCTSLKTIRIPNATIGSAVFAGCTGIENVDFANNVETIGSAQFAMCSSIESISLPNTLTAIYQNAFAGCTALATITIDKPENSISGAPWGATNANIVWTG